MASCLDRTQQWIGKNGKVLFKIVLTVFLYIDSIFLAIATQGTTKMPLYEFYKYCLSCLATAMLSIMGSILLCCFRGGYYDVYLPTLSKYMRAALISISWLPASIFYTCLAVPILDNAMLHDQHELDVGIASLAVIWLAFLVDLIVLCPCFNSIQHVQAFSRRINVLMRRQVFQQRRDDEVRLAWNHGRHDLFEQHRIQRGAQGGAGPLPMVAESVV